MSLRSSLARQTLAHEERLAVGRGDWSAATEAAERRIQLEAMMQLQAKPEIQVGREAVVEAPDWIRERARRAQRASLAARNRRSA